MFVMPLGQTVVKTKSKFNVDFISHPKLREPMGDYPDTKESLEVGWQVANFPKRYVIFITDTFQSE